MAHGNNARRQSTTTIYRRDAAFESRAKALASLPPVVYAVRVDGAIKIGHSTELHNRLRKYGPTAELLAFIPGTRSDEKSIHDALTPYRARGHEFYRPTVEVLDVVNPMRAALGLPLIAA
jgi:hypothetical protein